MEYPVWQLSYFGGGFWIAFIATIHVYVAHFAVGGGLFLVLTEMKGLREKSQTILDYVHRHARFFLLLTMVFGGVSGVGIWITISLLGPEATSTLIHTFVFGWATEWVCFLGEIVALLLYYYSFGKLSSRNHLRLGWLYFIFAWLSLLLINAIIAFMLTPGDWLKTGGFWDGFYNPSFWPSLFFRSFMILMVTGVFCFLTASRIHQPAVRLNMLRYCAKWVGFPFVLVLASGYWYVHAMPPEVQELILRRSLEIALAMKVFLWCGPLVVLGGAALAFKAPQRVTKSFVWLLLIMGFGFFGSFEYIREASRKPYIIHGYLYSNGIKVSREAEIRAKGVLAAAKWVQHRDPRGDNLLPAGEELFRILRQLKQLFYGLEALRLLFH
jgi:cytochrome bd-type quinol oxidase subunit 1